ncbi:orotate phosphoribosyltransferase [Elasticomyces elasticus]|nr:orotate phosphoribosyltransferase [Elasticomyces elasticus]KAK4984051.1 orotate phosphoribosyltransferase [Elasticomyces elasticus]
MPSAAQQPLPSHKAALLATAIDNNVLTFGTFTLKSGRTSPYFFNAGLFNTAKTIRALATAYAHTLLDHANTNPGWEFDVLFGPAYKGIPLAVATAGQLGEVDEERWGDVGYAFNRKEAKDHGEGGTIVGAALSGKKVVIIDDVMTAGTAMTEAVDTVKAQGGQLVGIIVALDRQETMKEGSKMSSLGMMREKTGVPVLSVLNLADMIVGLKGRGTESDVKRLEQYRAQYGASNA